MPRLKLKHLICYRCGSVAEVIGDRVLTEVDIPALSTTVGPICYGFFLLCSCGRSWIVLASDTGCWYGTDL